MFAVILDSLELPEPDAVASVLQQAAGLPAPVATKLARRARWIVWENAPPEAARAACQALIVQGVAARAIPQASLPVLKQPRRVHVLKLEEGALGVQLRYSGEPEWIPWSSVLILSTGAFRTETTKIEEVAVRDMMSGLPASEQRFKTDITRDIVAEFCADQVDGTLLHVRLHCHEMNYAQTLGASVHEGWREKFSVLLARLGMRATGALISPQTEALLAAGLIPGESLVSPYFANEEDFLAYNRWLLTRRRLGLGV